MSAFGGLILTNKGRALQAKAQAGATLHFNRIGVGDGNLGGQLIPNLTALINPKMSLSINKLKTQSGGKAIVGAVLSNQDVTVGFYFREIGVFAQDPDEGEILYCYGNAGAGAEYIPAAGGPDVVEKQIDIITMIANAANVTASVASGIYALSEDVGDMSTVPTSAKNAAGAITELYEALENADIPDATLTTKGKVQLSSATNSTAEDRAATPKAVKVAMDAASGVGTAVTDHVAASNVHGATSAATASRLIIRDPAGRAKVAAPSATDDIARLDSITKTQVGLGSVDNYGTATQAEAEAGASAAKFMTPQRTKQYVDTRLENNLEFRMNAGQLEYYNGTSWKGVGGELSAYPNVNTTVNPNLSIGSTASSWTSIVNINSKQGYFGRADVSAMSGNGMQLRITIDGVVKYFAKTSSTGFHLGVLPFYGEYASGNVLTSLPFPYINSASPAPTTTPFCLISGNLYFNTSLLIEVAPTLDVSTSVKIEIGYATN